MATGVFFHAHPDDEAIATGGTMAKATADGHRVVLVLATKGELGTPVPGVLEDGEELWTRREEETLRSAEILGAGVLRGAFAEEPRVGSAGVGGSGVDLARVGRPRVEHRSAGVDRPRVGAEVDPGVRGLEGLVFATRERERGEENERGAPPHR